MGRIANADHCQHHHRLECCRSVHPAGIDGLVFDCLLAEGHTEGITGVVEPEHLWGSHPHPIASWQRMPEGVPAAALAVAAPTRPTVTLQEAPSPLGIGRFYEVLVDGQALFGLAAEREDGGKVMDLTVLEPAPNLWIVGSAERADLRLVALTWDPETDQVTTQPLANWTPDEAGSEEPPPQVWRRGWAPVDPR